MSDENGEALFKPQGSEDGAGTSPPQTETPSQPVEEQSEEIQPKYVTEDILNQRLEEVRREVQSSRDKALSTFDKRYKEKLSRVSEIVEANKKAGIEMSPEKERALRMQALEEASVEIEPDSAQQPSGQPGAATPDVNVEAVVKETNARAAQISQQAGIQLEKEDPELMLLDQSTPEAYLNSFRNALYQKKLRTGESGASPQARVPTMGQGRRPVTDNEQQFLDEYKAAAGKGQDYARSIRKKWADRGVDVNTLASNVTK